MEKLFYGLFLIITLSACSDSSEKSTIMGNEEVKIWFEGNGDINCDLLKVEESLGNIGLYFMEIIKRMPSMTGVELIEQVDDFVTIKTDEGVLKRSNISISVESSVLKLEFDEEYDAGKSITTHAHFLHEFSKGESNVTHRLVITNLKAPGFMGFFYRKFGSSSMGKAFLKAHMNLLAKKD